MRIAASLPAALAVLALAGCQPLPDPKPVPPGGVLAAESLISSPQELAGRYRVAGIQGVDRSTLSGEFAVAITGDEIAVADNCLNLRWHYRFEGAVLVTEAVPGPACRRAMSPEEKGLSDAFAGTQSVRHTPERGIVFDGRGGTVTLFSH